MQTKIYCCIKCSGYFPDHKLINGKCPKDNSEVEEVSEKRSDEFMKITSMFLDDKKVSDRIRYSYMNKKIGG